MSTANDLIASLFALASDEKAAVCRRFFRTGPGQYGEGDRFLRKGQLDPTFSLCDSAGQVR